jgi:hypothetical protein
MRNGAFLRLVAPVRVAAVLLALGGIASADTLLTTSGLDLNLGGSVWQNANSTAADAYFAGIVYNDVRHNGAAYDRDSLWLGFYTDIYLAEFYGSPFRDLPKMDDRIPDQAGWLDRGMPPAKNEDLEPPATPADSSDDRRASAREQSPMSLSHGYQRFGPSEEPLANNPGIRKELA